VSALRGHRRPGIEAVLFSALVLVLAAAGCMDTAHLEKSQIRFTIDPAVKFAERNLIVFLVDGLRADVFERELEAGRLPNIEKYLVNRGMYGRRCLSSLLSCTYPDFSAVLTGWLPGHNGVPSMTFFNRRTLLSRRYDSPGRMGEVRDDLRRPTIFELVRPEHSVCILTQVSTGATYFVENFQTAGLAYFFRQWRWLDYLSVVRFRLVAELARRWGEYPRVVVTYFPSLDFIAYRYGVNDPRYVAMLHHTDFIIGLLMQTFQREGVLEKFTFVLTADHGHVETRPDGYFDIRALVDVELGIPATNASAGRNRSWEYRWDRFGEQAAVVLDAGNRAAMLYLRSFDSGPGPSALHPWMARPRLEELRAYPTRSGKAVDLVARLTGREELDLVLSRLGEDRVVVFSAGGEAVIRRKPPAQAGGEKLYSYSVVAGEDPIGYTDGSESAPLVGTGFHPGRLWLSRTVGTDYPDFVTQAAELFDSPLVGDLVVFARRGWSFHPTHRSDHGGPLAEEMLVPLVLAGPEIRRGELPVARQVDILPTLLEFLGRTGLEGHFDGRSFLDRVVVPEDRVKPAVPAPQD